MGLNLRKVDDTVPPVPGNEVFPCGTELLLLVKAKFELVLKRSLELTMDVVDVELDGRLGSELIIEDDVKTSLVLEDAVEFGERTLFVELEFG